MDDNIFAVKSHEMEIDILPHKYGIFCMFFIEKVARVCIKIWFQYSCLNVLYLHTKHSILVNE